MYFDVLCVFDVWHCGLCNDFVATSCMEDDNNNNPLCYYMHGIVDVRGQSWQMLKCYVRWAWVSHADVCLSGLDTIVVVRYLWALIWYCYLDGGFWVRNIENRFQCSMYFYVGFFFNFFCFCWSICHRFFPSNITNDVSLYFQPVPDLLTSRARPSGMHGTTKMA